MGLIELAVIGVIILAIGIVGLFILLPKKGYKSEKSFCFGVVLFSILLIILGIRGFDSLDAIFAIALLIFFSFYLLFEPAIKNVNVRLQISLIGSGITVIVGLIGQFM